MKPLRDLVVVKEESREVRALGGIILPDKMEIQTTYIARVVAKGVKTRYVTDGCRVLVSDYAGDKFEENGEKLVVLRERDITGIIVES